MMQVLLSLLLQLPSEPVTLLVTSEVLEALKSISDLKQQTQQRDQNQQEIAERLKNIDERLSRIEASLGVFKFGDAVMIDQIISGMKKRPGEAKR